MSLKIYNSKSDEVVFVQPDARNLISVNALNIEFGENVVALKVLTTDNVILKLIPSRSGYFRRRCGWSNCIRKITAIFGPRQQPPLTKQRRRKKAKKPEALKIKHNESLPEFVDFECDNYTERILVDKNGTISCADVDAAFQGEVTALKFTQESRCFMITPKKTRRFKLPKLNWADPFDVEPIFYNTYEHVQIAIDNGKSIEVTPDTNGDLILNDYLFGRDIQALDITYQNTIYRHKPIISNVFEEPEWGWDNSDFVKVILVTPIVQVRDVDYSFIFDEYPSLERNHFHDPYFDDWNYNSATYKVEEDKEIQFLIYVRMLNLVCSIGYGRQFQQDKICDWILCRR
uniref:WG repeat-containing protein n=1 Tax=Panagrellus redivivus TaxID=6233 RepID=A0A7E4V1C4_PANRE